jgi:hypothetical protein
MSLGTAEETYYCLTPTGEMLVCAADLRSKPLREMFFLFFRVMLVFEDSAHNVTDCQISPLQERKPFLKRPERQEQGAFRSLRQCPRHTRRPRRKQRPR